MSARRRLNWGARGVQNDEAPTRTPRDIYSEMLVDAGVGRSSDLERPLKRRKGKRRADGEDGPSVQDGPSARCEGEGEEDPGGEDDDEEGIEFEDVEIPKPTIQTTYMGSEDEDSEDDDDGVVFEDVDFNAPAPDEKAAEPSEAKAMELNLTAQRAAMSPARKRGQKKKPLTKEEKALRVDVHKTHLLCLIYHSAMRNKWCNDERVQKALKGLLTQRMVNYLNPSRKLTQFGRTEAFKKGLDEVGQMFRLKFHITERGLRRALWVEDSEDLSKVRTTHVFLEYCMLTLILLR